MLSKVLNQHHDLLMCLPPSRRKTYVLHHTFWFSKSDCEYFALYIIVNTYNLEIGYLISVSTRGLETIFELGAVLLCIGLGTIKGSHMCLHSYTFVFSLQETEESLNFDDLFIPNDATYQNSREEFEGFSYINHGVKQ